MRNMGCNDKVMGGHDVTERKEKGKMVVMNEKVKSVPR